MAESSPARRWRPPKVVRIIRARPRLFVCVLLGLAVLVLLPADWRLTTRLLVAWDVGVFAYLIAAAQSMLGFDPARMRRRAALLDEGAAAILAIVVVAALASLGAIVAQLGSSMAGSPQRSWHLALAFVTILLAWALIHVIFALHYAHEFYARGAKDGGLAFPGNEAPDYWDFVYFSLVIGMTSQVSDVAVTGRHIRRTVAVHGVVSFLFNAALIALTVNIAASALAG